VGVWRDFEETSSGNEDDLHQTDSDTKRACFLKRFPASKRIFGIPMDIKEFWSELFLAFGGSSVVISGLFTWLGKRYLDKILEAEKARNQKALEEQRNQFTLEFEQIKSGLAKELALELEKVKSELAKELTLFSATVEAGVGPHSLLFRSLNRLILFCRSFRDRYFNEFSKENCDRLDEARNEYQNCWHILRTHELILGDDVSFLSQKLLKGVDYEFNSFWQLLGYRHLKDAPDIPLADRFAFEGDPKDYSHKRAHVEAVEGVQMLNNEWEDLRSLLYSKVPKIEHLDPAS
jgi:hypothetical protein